METTDAMVENGAQKRFDALYISSTDICQRLGVTRVQLFMRRKRGLLPGGIVVNGAQIILFERATIEPYIVRWNRDLVERRGALMA